MKIEMSIRLPWRTGFTILTADTRKWKQITREANDSIEARRIYSNFNVEDEGRSRVLIAVCETRDMATTITDIKNALVTRIEELEAAIRDHRLILKEHGTDTDETLWDLVPEPAPTTIKA